MNFDIGGADRDVFTPLEVTTRSKVVFLKYENGEEIYFDEKDIWDKIPVGEIIRAVDCNFGHKKSEHKFVPPPKESNRGRKPIDRTLKESTRKKIGDGTSFNTQMTITAMGEYVRRLGYKGKKEEIVREIDGMAYIEKEYSIKVFRNGNVVIVGCMEDDMSDIMMPLLEICDALSNALGRRIVVSTIEESMRNYKFYLKNNANIDMNRLVKYLKSMKSNDLIGINRSYFLQILTQPKFIHGFDKWTTDSEVAISRKFKQLDNSVIELVTNNMNTFKDRYVSQKKFAEAMEYINLEYEYRSLNRIIKTLKHVDYTLPEEIYIDILHHNISIKWEKLCAEWPNQGWFTYDPEKYSGMLLRIRTPIDDDPNKIVTAKIFGSGKINVDGCAPEITAVEKIYKDLGKILWNAGAIFTTKYIYHTEDDEFPM